MKNQSADQRPDSLPSGLAEKQLLLDCLLQNPTRSWLHYLDGRQALRVGVLLHLGKLSLPRDEFPDSPRRKA